jgi:metal-sulfur cluster biosynthetic enzyme
LEKRGGHHLENDLTKRVSERLDELVDEETTRKFGELNIVTDVTEMASGSLMIKFQPLSAYSPLAVEIGKSIREAALSVDGVKAVRVVCGGHMMDDLVDRIVNKEVLKAKRAK